MGNTHSHPVKLTDFIFEKQVYGKEVKKEFLPTWTGDVYQTNADCSALELDMGDSPHRALNDGILEFMKWYREYYIKKYYDTTTHTTTQIS